MMQREARVMLAGGGTGGHVFPAIYIAKFLKEHWGAQCLFLGTKKGIEQLKVPQAGFVLKNIWISGIKRGIYLSNLLFPLKLVISLFQSRKEINAFKPDLVIGTGGYVSGPVLYQATKMNIPTAIQEQNSYPGITTRILSTRVDRVFLAYEESLKFLKPAPGYRIVGNPVPVNSENLSAAEARKFFDLSDKQPIILVFGGSQGALSINNALDILLSSEKLQDLQIIWQTGLAHFDHYKEKYIKFKNPNLRILPFIDRMDYAYLISDIAICRAGAMTISELAAAGLPAILVPLAHAAANHQLKNARTIEQGGGAIIIEDNQNISDQLLSTLDTMLASKDKLKHMGQNIARFHKPEALIKITTELKKMIQRNGHTDL